jgi:hypothetical protein
VIAGDCHQCLWLTIGIRVRSRTWWEDGFKISDGGVIMIVSRSFIVERVVEKVASVGPMNYPILMKTNYNQ